MKYFIALTVATIAAFAQAQSFQIQALTSPAGHNLWLVEDHSNPIVSMEITFKNGSYQDPVGLEGTAAILGWLFNEGAGTLSAEAFQGIMSDESFSISADAGFERTTVTLQYLTENQDLAVDLLTSAFSEPRFDADAIDRAKDYFEAQVIRRQNGPGQEFSDLFGPLQYGEGHAFLRYYNGTLDSLAAISRQDLLDAHQRTYTKFDVEVNAVGDIYPENLGKIVDLVLQDLPDGQQAPIRPAPDAPATNVELVTDYAQPVTFVIGSANGIDHNEPDLNAARVADQILGGDGLSSRLFQAVREEAGLVYSIGSSLSASRDFGRIGFRFQTANDNVDEALSLTFDVIREFAEDGPTEEEVERAIDLITGSYPLRFQTSLDIVGYMNTLRVLGLPPEFPTVRNAQYEAVTIEDVKRVARRLYADKDFLIGMIGRPENRTVGVRVIDE